jgi:hypothetical protein
MSDPGLSRTHRLVWMVAGALFLVVSVPASVIAAHQFNDVPNSNPFHSSISWLAENGITIGCNPPSNSNFCPKDNVTREQMAAFLHRQAQTSGNVGTQVTGVAGNIGITTTSYRVLLSIEATPEAEAAVTLTAHAALERSTASNGYFLLRIARTSCTGTVVGAARWRANINTDGGGSFESVTVPITGTDVISSDTTYVLCAAKNDPSSGNVSVFERGLTATWAPTT